MSNFNAVRNHLALIQFDADRLLKEINQLEEDHEENRITICRCDKEFAQAKAEEDKVHAELEKAWKKTDKFKCKQRKLDRKQADLQSEQAAKWEQYKTKAAIVHELRILCRESYAFPKNEKRAHPTGSYDQAGPIKKTKVCSAQADPFEDDEEYVVPLGFEGLETELGARQDQEAEHMPDTDNYGLKEENSMKREDDGVKTENDAGMKQAVKQEVDIEHQAGNFEAEVINLEEDEDY
ncbi:hypothetical protein FKW77_007274 [Venturia effusa]|uniref:Uncharacterized protein n=1 Tax=Venturia effusa TaxID=50376 RepID=A0A517KZN9_9PEZI|nr:hypothetical protein FKW77_007274 [Venturia effusa]